ncbi:MAG: LysM peptidoglycan-binding domain-containing protein [Lentisphaeria bacterium]|nr:LysM peptidoglycan-binding domain-containing protein [Lentisphaeria bacterium]
MKRTLSGILGGTALLALLTGCDPELAQIPAGSQEELWYRQLKDNYSSFRPPQTPAPAAYNRQAAPAPVSAAKAQEKPVDDPESAVDRAAVGEKVEPQVAPRDEAAPKSADKADGAAAKAESDKAPGAEKAAGGEKAAGSGDEVPAGKPYIVVSGDTLGGIAKKFYGKSSLDDVIFRANTKVIKDRNKLSPGMRLVIPDL